MTTPGKVYDSSQRLIHEGPTTKWISSEDEVMKIQIYLPREKRFADSAFPLTVVRDGEADRYVIQDGFYEDFHGTFSFMGYLR